MKISKTQLEIIEEIYRKTVFEPLETFSPDYVEEANHKSKIFYKKLESKLGKEIANEFEETYNDGIASNQHQGFICGILFGLGISGKLD